MLGGLLLTEKQKSSLADVSLLAGAMLWGGSFIAVKDALNYFSPFTLMAIRFTLATFVMYIFFFRKIGKFQKKDLKHCFWLGIFSFMGFSFQTIGLLYTTVTKQGLLTSLYVIIVPFLVWIIYKNPPGLRIILSGFMAIVGVYLMSSGGADDISLNLGDILTILSAFVYAVMIVYIDKALNDIKPIKLVFLQLPFAAILMWIVAIPLEDIPHNPEISSFFSLFYLGILATFLASVFQIFGQKYTAPSRASLLMTTEALFAVLFAVLFLKESMNFQQIAGMVIMIIAVILIEFQPKVVSKLNENDIV